MSDSRPDRDDEFRRFEIDRLRDRWAGGDTASSSAPGIDRGRIIDVVEIAAALGSAVTLGDLFARIESAVFRQLRGIERLALLVHNPETARFDLLHAAVRPESTRLSTTTASDGAWVSRSVCERAFNERVAIMAADASEDSRFSMSQSIVLQNIRTVMAVPLMDDGGVIGVLYGDSLPGGGSGFDLAAGPAALDDELGYFGVLANLIGASLQRWRLQGRLREEEGLRERLSRYHSPAVVAQLVAMTGHEVHRRLEPIEADISVLFADLVGFTSMSERLSPIEVANLLNLVFEELSTAVFAHGGTLDKYLGDAVMALYGAPEHHADHADRALESAIDMLERVERLNREHAWPEHLMLRVAVNSGRACVGDVGSTRRLEYTALGATVNLAARLEEIGPPGECVITEMTRSRLTRGATLVSKGPYLFRGVAEPIEVFQTARSAAPPNEVAHAV